MFRFIKNKINIYKPPLNKEIPKETHLLSSSLNENINYFKDKFNNSLDLTIRKFDISNSKSAIITMEGMIDKDVLANSVINPIVFGNFHIEDPIEKYEYIKDHILATSEQIEVLNYEDAFSFVMSGFALLAIDGSNRILAIGIQGFKFRNISEPSTEVAQRGSRESFVEALRINMTMIRRRMKNPDLKFESMTVGSVSKTSIALCYLNSVVSKDILNEIKVKLKQVNLETVLASEYIVPYLEEKGDLSLFNSIGVSERPDTVCGKISEGRVAILVDGTPDVLVVPFLFVEYFQSFDDYVLKPYFATFIRWIKYISFFVAVLLPGLYVAVGTFDPELFPIELLNKVTTSVSITPFPLVIEALVINFMYEVMREAGLRLPKTLGHAVSIVGALVIGETATTAGLIAAPTLMIIALSALCSYIIPNLYEPIGVLRVTFIIVGAVLGIWGIMLLFTMVIINICSKENFGVPFISPIAPFSMFAMRDVAIRAGWKILSKRDNYIQKMPGVDVKHEEENL